MLKVKNKILILITILLKICTPSQILQSQSLTLTIYNNDFALVKDVRLISFDKGQSFLYFTDVASNIQTQTVTFKPKNNPSSIRIYEQNFEKNLINRESILKKYINKYIIIYAEFGNSYKIASGQLLGYNSGFIIKTSKGINIFNNIAATQFPTLPDGLFIVPTLNWKIWSSVAQNNSCQVSYRAIGFKWTADYSLILNKDQTKADIGGWVTIDNRSGKKYQNAQLKLIAGDVNTIKQVEPIPRPEFARREKIKFNLAPQFKQKQFADYHMYTLNKLVTLNQSSQKQVQFMSKVFQVPMQKYYEININAGGYSQDNLEIKNIIKFQNIQSNGLGIALPKGTIRVFKQDDSDKSQQFVGQDSIDHTPKNENITIKIGKAFDVVANKIASSWLSTNNNGGYSANLQLKIRNRKTTSAKIEILFNNIYGDNLLIQAQLSQKPEKVSAMQYRWIKQIQPQSQYNIIWRQNYSR